MYLDCKYKYGIHSNILNESVVREAYLANTRDQGLVLINNRLKNRITFCEYDKVILGPIHDSLGVEQGGKNLDRFFKLCGNSQLKQASSQV